MPWMFGKLLDPVDWQPLGPVLTPFPPRWKTMVGIVLVLCAGVQAWAMETGKMNRDWVGSARGLWVAMLGDESPV